MTYDATIDRLAIFALFELKGPAKALENWAPALPGFPTVPNTLTRKGPDMLAITGPDRWLLLSNLDHETRLADALRPADAPPEVSIVRISDTLTFFRITGPDAPQVMSIGCPLDLHPDVFGPDAIGYTQFFGIRALVLRCEGGFECAIEQSFGDMIADYLSRALA